LSARWQCELLGLARSNVYYQPAETPADDLRLMRLIDEVYTARPFYGSRRMTALFKTQGHEVNLELLLTALAPVPGTAKIGISRAQTHGFRSPKYQLIDPYAEACPKCGAEACVADIDEEDTRGQYHCFACGEYGDYRHCCDCGQLCGELPVPEERTTTATSLTTGARTAGLTCSQGMIDEPRRTA
jgi:hypothetical protein